MAKNKPLELVEDDKTMNQDFILLPPSVQAALKDLFELCKKHKIKISGCGCCGSPSIDFERGFSATGLKASPELVQIDSSYDEELESEGKAYIKEIK